MMTHADLTAVADSGARELAFALAEDCAAALRQAARGACLAVIGFGVILSVAATLIGIQELGAAAGPALPPGQIQHQPSR